MIVIGAYSLNPPTKGSGKMTAPFQI